MAQPELDIWMNGEHVGTWFWSRTGTPGLRYAASWLDSPHARPLSLSLPIPLGVPVIQGPRVEHWFENLLPENQALRDRLRRRFGAASIRAADLLAAIGRDCVGAVQLLPAGSAPPQVDRIESEPLADKDVERLLLAVSGAAPSDDAIGDLRISIAGAQEKTALLRRGRRWHRPAGATPTTHILKLPLGTVGPIAADMRSSVENEWLCAQILAALGFPVARASIEQFGGQKALAVERFDRQPMDRGRWIARLPQEDFCQALGVPAMRKYEGDGGPGIAAAFQLLSAAQDPLADKLRFALAQLAFWLLAAIDGHAKNFSIFLGPGGSFQMTPLYDVLSAWPIIGNGPHQQPLQRAKMAMALRSRNAHYRIADIRVRHWRALALHSGAPAAFEHMVALVEALPAALAKVEASLPPGFPARVWDSIRTGALAQARRFQQELA
jgi:serine/threonine-protein kinase HipA